MKCAACKCDDTGIESYKLFEEITIYVHDSQYQGVPMVDGKGVHLYACLKCGTVRMER